MHQANLSRRPAGVATLILAGALCSLPAMAANTSELEQRIADLQRQLAEAERDLAEARGQTQPMQAEPAPAAEETEQVAAAIPPPEDKGFHIGPVKIGGAARVNYVLGSYQGYDGGPNRGGNGGNVELDTFRINLALDYNNIIGALEYRWYPAGTGTNYNFMHSGWLGYRFQDDSEVKVGLNRVPFGPGPYGVSQSWFFDQHYYVGLADDMDLGVKYSTSIDNWTLDFAYYAGSEGGFFGRSLDSARYGYDAVRWTESADADGNVIYGGAHNGYDERNQFNVRAIYSLSDARIPTDIGVSLQYGQLKGQRADDGSHWAASAHMINRYDNWTLATQLTRYEYDIDSDNPWGTDTLIPMGAYDFAWPVAAKAWIPAISISYKYETPQIPWLDYVLPYVEYSSIVKDESDFNNSDMLVVGAAWARGGWYIYSDLAFSNGNYFVGNEAADDGSDDYGSLYGVGDFGANGNDEWNYRFNLNLGYYF
ncbi:type IV pilus assembly protein FimV [Imhoffiella purpurea]|nr:carbohydrate porin [Imhoffiella purpurea]